MNVNGHSPLGSLSCGRVAAVEVKAMNDVFGLKQGGYKASARACCLPTVVEMSRNIGGLKYHSRALARIPAILGQCPLRHETERARVAIWATQISHNSGCCAEYTVAEWQYR